MRTEKELNEMILVKINKIRRDHPELLKYLSEMPMTIPDEKNPEINLKALESYYDSLVNVLQDYDDNNAENLVSNTSENLIIPNITAMKTNNNYHNSSIEVYNSTLSYNDVGEGTIPILFLHGFPFDKSMWNEQLDSLKSLHRVIAVDIRGFGQSKDENTDLTIDLFAEDVIAMMDKLAIKKAIICGLSMGGFIALNTIKRFPERFEALLLCDTNCVTDTPEAKEKRYKTIEQITSEGTNEFNEKFIKNVFHPDSLINKKELVNDLRSTVFANSERIITAGLVALAERSETCSSLKAIKMPTLIICGRQDEVTPLAQSQFMHEHIDGSVLKIIENAGHVSNLEQPQEFNKYLHDFLNSLEVSKKQ